MRKSDFIGLALLGFVIGCRYSAPVADFYAQKCYPVLSTVLSRVVSACPVSLEEVVVVGFIVTFLVVLLGSLFRRKGFFHWLGRTARVAMWLVARDYWDGKKVKVVDDFQRWVMDLYLKSNHVPEGARDYAGVVGMIMTMDKIK